MIRKKDKVYLHGQMAESMMENGKMENNMGLDIILLLLEKSKEENGKMVKDLNG